MQGHRLTTGVWEGARSWPGTDQENLDRALVAGLLLEVILDGTESPDHHQSQGRAVKARLQHRLATRLAGRVTLDHFRALIHNLDSWFPHYYPLLAPAGAGGGRDQGWDCSRPEAHPASCRSPLREEVLEAWLSGPAREMLPSRPHRKVSPALLPDFLRRTRGGMFRIKDFESYFGIDRKTAWEYLQKLQAAGLLCHNGERSAAVRYCLADRFLRVRAAALRRQMGETLGDLPRPLAVQAADWLIATGGEAFWENQWQGWPDRQRRKIIAALQTARILRVAARTSGGQLLRLAGQWRQGNEDEKFP